MANKFDKLFSKEPADKKNDAKKEPNTPGKRNPNTETSTRNESIDDLLGIKKKVIKETEEELTTEKAVVKKGKLKEEVKKENTPPKKQEKPKAKTNNPENKVTTKEPARQKSDTKETETKKGKLKTEEERTESSVRLIRELLTQDTGTLRYGIERIETMLNRTEKLDEQGIADQILGIHLPLDTESYEWDKYFTKYKIPKEQQEVFKREFKTLYEGQDYGNIVYSDGGQRMDEETKRILALKDGDPIVLSIGELSPTGGRLHFETKKEALLYIYYQKLLARQIPEIFSHWLGYIQTAGRGGKAVFDYAQENPGVVAAAFATYVGVNTALTLVRKVNFWLLKSTSGKIGSGNYLDKSLLTADGSTAKEAGELVKRERILEVAQEVYKGDPKKLEYINRKLGQIMFILDHNVDGIKGGKYWEGTFWRKIYQLQGGVFTGKWIDTFFKTFLVNKETSGTVSLAKALRIKNEVLTQLFETQGRPLGSNGEVVQEVVPGSPEKKIIKDIRDHMELSHDVSNEKELERRAALDKFVDTLRRGEIPYINGMSQQAALTEIKRRLLMAATGKKIKRRDVRQFEKKALIDVQDTKILETNYEKILDTKVMEAHLEGKEYDKGKVEAELKTFIESIGGTAGKNRYNFKTASAIIEHIINGKTQSEATKLGFAEKWQELDTRMKNDGYLARTQAKEIERIGKLVIAEAKKIPGQPELEKFEREVVRDMLDRTGLVKPGFEKLHGKVEDIIAQKKANNFAPAGLRGKIFGTKNPPTLKQGVPAPSVIKTAEAGGTKSGEIDIAVFERELKAAMVEETSEAKVKPVELKAAVNNEAISPSQKTNEAKIEPVKDATSTDTNRKKPVKKRVPKKPVETIGTLTDTLESKLGKTANYINTVSHNNSEIIVNIEGRTNSTSDGQKTVKGIALLPSGPNVKLAIERIVELASGNPKSLSDRGTLISNLKTIPGVRIVEYTKAQTKALLGTRTFEGSINGKKAQSNLQKSTKIGRKRGQKRVQRTQKTAKGGR